MTKTIELLLKITVDNEQVTVEVDHAHRSLPVLPDYDGPLTVSVDLKASDTYTTTTWHGSEEMWYTSYKE